MRQGFGVVVLALAIPLVTVVADPFGWYPFGPSKWIVISTLIPAGFALLWWHRPAGLAPRALLPVAALVGWLTVCAWAGEDRLYAWIGTPERRFGVLTWILIGLMFLAGQSLDPDRDRRPLSWAIVAAGLMTGGMATAEALGWEPDLFAVTPGRLTSTMGSAAYLGAVTAVLLPALVGLALDQGGWQETDSAPERRVVPPRVVLGCRHSENQGVANPASLLGGRLAALASKPFPARHLGTSRTQRIAAVIGAVVTAIACVGSGARAAWLGLAVAGAVLVVARRRALFVHRRRAVGLAGALALGLVMLMAVSPFGHRLAQATDPDAAGGRSRVDEWRVAASVIVHHPVTGVGPEGYRVSFAEGVTDSYEQAYGRDPLPDRAHAGPLDVALAGGLPALLAWAVAVGWMLRAAYRAMRTADADHRWLAGLGAAFVAHLAGQLLLFPTAELEPLMWMVGGLLVATDQVFTANSAPTDHAGGTDEMVRRRAILLPRFVPCLLGAVALVAAYAGARAMSPPTTRRRRPPRGSAAVTWTGRWRRRARPSLCVRMNCVCICCSRNRSRPPSAAPVLPSPRSTTAWRTPPAIPSLSANARVCSSGAPAPPTCPMTSTEPAATSPT